MKKITHILISLTCIAATAYMCYEAWIKISTQEPCFKTFMWCFATAGWFSITHSVIKKEV